jgi:orotidine-5'-phosphate decarboxylase
MSENYKHNKLLTALRATSEPQKIRQLTRQVFPGVRPVEKGDSQVRNTLRALVCRGLVQKVGRGTYQATAG